MIASDLAYALDPAMLLLAAGLEPDPWQRDLLRDRPHRALLNCTRQAGKSTTTAALALHAALYEPPALVLLLSPSHRQSKLLFSKVKALYRAHPCPCPILNDSATEAHFANQSQVISLPADPDKIRGFSGVDLLVFDEAGYVREDLFNACTPMLAVSGGRMVALTTPKGRRGFFYEEWIGPGDAWTRIKITADDCPRIDRDFLEEERRRMGERFFRQEYYCEFHSADRQVFDQDLINRAISDDVQPLFF